MRLVQGGRSIAAYVLAALDYGIRCFDASRGGAPVAAPFAPGASSNI